LVFCIREFRERVSFGEVDMFEPVIVYTVVVAVLGFLLLAKAIFQLNRSTLRRKQLLADRKRMDAVPAHPPTGDSFRIAQERGLSSIEDTFTITRRLAVPLIVGATLMAISIPYLSKTPGAFVSAAAAAMTVVVGIAAKPFVENAIAGLVISFSKLINIGDTLLIDTQYGTVEDITTTHTTIKLWDWRRHVLPNSKMLQTEFTNYSLFDRDIWAHVKFWVAYDADLTRVREIALSCAGESSHFAGNEPASFWVMDLEREGIHCWVAAWARTPSDAWMLAGDMRTKLATDLREDGIATHVHQHAWSGPSSSPENRPGDQAASG
jgi:small-conductance mechanosensitive channel